MKNFSPKIDFFLVGAARCGTTSLYNYLNSNSSIFLPNVKEPNFFSEVESPKKEDFDIPKPGRKYHSKIINDPNVYNSLYREAKENQIKGDTSPSYIWDINTAQRLYKHNPKAKIIISLRHPVDRAYSHFIMNYYTGVDNSSTFERALKAKKNPIWGSCNQYLEMGMYFDQVKAYYDIFPKNQIKIIVHEQWTRNIEETLTEIFDYLEVDYTQSGLDVHVENNRIQPLKQLRLLNFLRGNLIKSAIKKIINQDTIDKLKIFIFSDSKQIEKINPDLREQLTLKFKDDINNLSKLTEIDFTKIWNL